jgi:biotin carboxyl carrier protein
MKYFVRIGDEDHEVVLDGEGIQIDGTPVTASVTPFDGTPVRTVSIGSEIHRVVLRRGAQRGNYTLWLDGFRFEVEALDERARAIRELSKTSSAPTGPAPLLAPMPGLVVRVTVTPGDEVRAGQGLVVMEAMKMENELRAVAAGRVKAVLAQPGMAVEKGTLLVELE